MDNNYLSRKAIGSREILAYNEQAKAHKEIIVSSVPDSVHTDISTIKFVGKGNVCRVIDITPAVDGFIRFGDSTLTATGITTANNAVFLSANGEITLVATDDYIISDKAFRVEVTLD